ncbi:MAG TPA: type II toxin-antitoxin system RelE/ParE family toxin [Bryobacteraceae bacterium]|jgi:plasmid stabilization system protein ParE|nr:type II toxin-antitoxin system RelE/ParE family toxin [Bryobacteraceae bacterium]
MTAEHGFRLHPLAARDITEIWGYIAKDNLLAARRVREEVLSRIRAVVVPFPNQGHKRPDLTGRPLRFISAREYLIAQGLGELRLTPAVA